MPSFRRRYYFDGYFWYKIDEGKKMEQLNQQHIDIMKRNTIEGQWVSDSEFQIRNDVRTWVTKQDCV